MSLIEQANKFIDFAESFWMTVAVCWFVVSMVIAVGYQTSGGDSQTRMNLYLPWMHQQAKSSCAFVIAMLLKVVGWYICPELNILVVAIAIGLSFRYDVLQRAANRIRP